MGSVGMLQIQWNWYSEVLKRKRRRIKATKNSIMQSYQVYLIAFAITVVLTGAINFVRYTIPTISTFITVPFFIVLVLDCILVIIFIITWIQREEVSSITIPNMSSNARQLSKNSKNYLMINK